MAAICPTVNAPAKPPPISGCNGVIANGMASCFYITIPTKELIVSGSEIAPAIVGYFGQYGPMRRGQRLAVLAEARGGRFIVAPVDKRRIVGAVRAVLRKNLAMV